VREVSIDSYNDQQISAAGPTEWPPCSLDLNVLYFYLWGKCLNSLQIFPGGSEKVIRRRFRKDFAGRYQSGYVAADHIPACCSFDIDWAHLYSTNRNI
jgi:hypothetical protein